MQYRRLGKTGYDISAISFGAWAIGGSWGQVDDPRACARCTRRLDVGVTFFDTADVYGDGHSERLLGRFLRERAGERLIVATKMGRRLPQVTANYTPEHFLRMDDPEPRDTSAWIAGPGAAALPADRPVLHPELFAALDELVDVGRHRPLRRERRAGRGRPQGDRVSGRRKRPDHLQHRAPASGRPVPAEAARRDVGVLARVPLASGLLTGKLTEPDQFAPDDHRNFNRHGESFDVGETFSGLDYRGGLQVVERLRPLVPSGATLGQLALRWILMSDSVTAAIPGARTPEQAVANAAAADLPPLPDDTMAAIRQIYDELARPLVHQRW